MRRAIVYIMLLTLLLSVLTGCGRMFGDNSGDTGYPSTSASPIMPTPDAGDGIVNDRDGFINDNDTGTNGGTNGGVNGGVNGGTNGGTNGGANGTTGSTAGTGT